MEIRRGEIYLVDLGKQEGSVQGGIRPCVVVSNAKNNNHAPTVNVIPLTTKDKNNLPVHIVITKDCGVKQESIILPEQIRTINKNQLQNKVGELTIEVLRQLNKAIKIQTETQEVVNVDQIVEKFIIDNNVRNNKEKVACALKKSLQEFFIQNTHIICI